VSCEIHEGAPMPCRICAYVNDCVIADVLEDRVRVVGDAARRISMHAARAARKPVSPWRRQRHVMPKAVAR
jgi:hypothetical protein